MTQTGDHWMTRDLLFLSPWLLKSTNRNVLEFARLAVSRPSNADDHAGTTLTVRQTLLMFRGPA